MDILGEVYPAYRLFIIAVGLAVIALLYLGLDAPGLGAVVRAGVDDRTMVAAMGIDVERAFFLVFCLGCWLAGLAGVVSAPVFSIFPGMDMSILILTLIVVVIGGPGSLKGAVAGSLAIGMADTYGQVLAPEFAQVTIYALMAAILLVRPQGLFPVAPRLTRWSGNRRTGRDEREGDPPPPESNAAGEPFFHTFPEASWAGGD